MPYSMRQLVWMAEAKQIEDWNHTSIIVSMIHNTAFGIKRSQQRSPEKFHPYAKRFKRKLSNQESRLRLKALAGLKEVSDGSISRRIESGESRN